MNFVRVLLHAEKFLLLNFISQFLFSWCYFWRSSYFNIRFWVKISASFTHTLLYCFHLLMMGIKNPFFSFNHYSASFSDELRSILLKPIFHWFISNMPCFWFTARVQLGFNFVRYAIRSCRFVATNAFICDISLRADSTYPFTARCSYIF